MERWNDCSPRRRAAVLSLPQLDVDLIWSRYIKSLQIYTWKDNTHEKSHFKRKFKACLEEYLEHANPVVTVKSITPVFAAVLAFVLCANKEQGECFHLTELETIFGGVEGRVIQREIYGYMVFYCNRAIHSAIL